MKGQVALHKKNKKKNERKAKKEEERAIRPERQEGKWGGGEEFFVENI
jgi:hypothetical protein